MKDTYPDDPDPLLDKDVYTREVPATALAEGNRLLTAPAYSSDVGDALTFLAESEYDTVPLGELCDRIFRKSRFKRVWVQEAEHGYPYMAPKDMMYLKPYLREVEQPEKAYVAKEEYREEAEEYMVEPGWILLTCSGRVGRAVLATESLTDYFFTHDLIRAVPKDDAYEGYLYAYLNSWLGQALLKREKFGVTVKHIEPHQVEDVPVLMLPEEEQKQIHERIKEAYDHRDEFIQMDDGVRQEFLEMKSD
jgi:type I restriction enzyme S subunit